jgi:deoxyhypusine synthase
MKHSAKTPQFEELRSLDLQKCHSVGDIVDAMRYCAFGARMLGEVAKTISTMASAEDKPLLVYDGLEKSPLHRVLQKFVEQGWCRRMITPAAFAKQKARAGNIIVVGAVSQTDAAPP